MTNYRCLVCKTRLNAIEAVQHDDETRHPMINRDGILQQFDSVRKQIAAMREARPEWYEAEPVKQSA